MFFGISHFIVKNLFEPLPFARLRDMYQVLKRVAKEVLDLLAYIFAALIVGVSVEVLNWWMPTYLAIGLVLIASIGIWRIVRRK